MLQVHATVHAETQKQRGIADPCGEEEVYGGSVVNTLKCSARGRFCQKKEALDKCQERK